MHPASSLAGNERRRVAFEEASEVEGVASHGAAHESRPKKQRISAHPPGDSYFGGASTHLGSRRWTAPGNRHLLPVGPHILRQQGPRPDCPPEELSTPANGVYEQPATTDTMIWTIPRTTRIPHRTVTLQPGDPTGSGTCDGTGMGRHPQEFMHPDDTVTVGVSNVGYPTSASPPDGPPQHDREEEQ